MTTPRLTFLISLVLSVMFTSEINAQDQMPAKIIPSSDGDSYMTYYETFLAYNDDYYVRFAFKAKYVDDNTYKYRLVASKYSKSTDKWIEGQYLMTFNAPRGSSLWMKIAQGENPDMGIGAALVLSNGNLVVAGDNFLVLMDKDLKKINNYGDKGHYYTSLCEDKTNNTLVACYTFNNKQIGTMLIHLDTKKNEWNEPALKPYGQYDNKSFPVKNNKVIMLLDMYSSSHDDNKGSKGQRVIIMDRSELSVIEETLDWKIYSNKHSINTDGIFVGDHYRDSDETNNIVVIDILNNKALAKITLEEDEYIEEIKWIDNSNFEVYFNQNRRIIIRTYDKSGELKSAKISSKLPKNPVFDNISYSIDKSYAIYSEIDNASPNPAAIVTLK